MGELVGETVGELNRWIQVGNRKFLVVKVVKFENWRMFLFPKKEGCKRTVEETLWVFGCIMGY